MLGLVKMHFTAPVHLGKAGMGLEESGRVLHSDTLFSGLFQAWLALYGEPPPPLVLSSAFPFVGDTLYLPKPFLAVPAFTTDLAATYGKTIKAATLVDLATFASWVAGETPDFERLQDELDHLKEAVRVSVRPRVALDRETSASALYYIGETFFTPGAGLFFLVEAGKGIWEALQGAVRVLGEEGLGGKRSQGRGTFRPEFCPDPVPQGAANPDAFLTLSLVYPAAQEEITGNLLSYQLLQRTGWLESGPQNAQLLHRRVLMFAEGSVFRRRPRGRLVEVTPAGFTGHPVYRYGLAFTLGVVLS